MEERLEPLGPKLHETTPAQPSWQDRETAFRRDLEHLLNSHSRENGSDTPDFILAQFLGDSLRAWDAAVSRRSQWYGDKRHTISGSDAADDDDMPTPR